MKRSTTKWNRVVVDKPLSVRRFPKFPFCNTLAGERGKPSSRERQARVSDAKARSPGNHTEQRNQTPHPKYEQEKEQESPCYELGDLLRCRHHIIHRKEDEGRKHIRLISKLKESDAAFVKRTDRSFSYAIVTKRYFDPEVNQDVLVFAITEDHSKIIPERMWKSCIRVERRQYHQEQLQSHEVDRPSGVHAVLKSPRSVREEFNRSLSHSLHKMRRRSSHMSHDSSTVYWA